VLIEKINNINSIELYHFERYDTVEVTYYGERRRIGINGYSKFHTTKGFIIGYGYRMDKKLRTIGYCNVYLCVKGRYGNLSEHNICDSKELNKQGKHVNMYPTRMVLTEKNYVEKYDIFEREFRQKYESVLPINGG